MYRLKNVVKPSVKRQPWIPNQNETVRLSVLALLCPCRVVTQQLATVAVYLASLNAPLSQTVRARLGLVVCVCVRVCACLRLILGSEIGVTRRTGPKQFFIMLRGRVRSYCPLFSQDRVWKGSTMYVFMYVLFVCTGVLVCACVQLYRATAGSHIKICVEWFLSELCPHPASSSRCLSVSVCCSGVITIVSSDPHNEGVPHIQTAGSGSAVTLVLGKVCSRFNQSHL